jgi:CheY-like chemotaxis protein
MSNSKQRILVVEDDLFSRELLTDWLEVEGYEVISVDTLRAGIRSVQNQWPDLVLLDVKLGNEDGLALASWIRRQRNLPPIPVIAVTAHAMVTERERILQAGCNAFVPKPVDFATLRDSLRKWLLEEDLTQTGWHD